MATTHPTGLLDRRRSFVQCQKPKLSQHVQELRGMVAVQEEGRKIFTQACGAKLAKKRELLPPLREAVQADVRALGFAQKRDKLPISEVCGVQKHLDIALARKTVEEAKEKLRAKIYKQVNRSNALLDQVRQRVRAKEDLQKRLQRLQDIQLDDKRHQAQLQVIRQLENNIQKMLTKVHAAERVTSQYLEMRDVLRKELVYLPQTLDLLSGMAELYQGELADKQLMDFACAALPADSRRHLPPRPKSKGPQELFPQDAISLRDARGRSSRKPGTTVETIVSLLEREAWLTAAMEKAKAVTQSVRFSDIPSRILAGQEYSGDMERHYIDECQEKQRVLKELLKELELKEAEMKFRQLPNTARVVEEELRKRLQREQARLGEMRAQMLRNQELLLKVEDAIDNLFFHLHDITGPEQEESVKAERADEKLHACKQKLQYLLERVGSFSADSQSLDTDTESFVKHGECLKKTTANTSQTLTISLEDPDTWDQDPKYSDDDDDHVLTREDIKEQGLQLIKSMKKSTKKW